MTSKKGTSSDVPPPMIVVKKTVHKGGHHGGAWKVAYADFVTTMMALFIVLWAAGQDTNVRESIATYFRNPNTPVRIAPTGGRGTSLLPAGTGAVGQAQAAAQSGSAADDDDTFRRTAESIRLTIDNERDLRDLSQQVRIDLTPEGLRVQFVEFDESLFFEIGSGRLKPALTRLIAIVGAAIGQLPNGVIVEGHTDRRAYSGRAHGYTNWELSADRANSARRVLESSGLRPDQVVRVVGCADHEPLVADNPLDRSNRRVSVIVKRRPDSAPGIPPSTAPPTPGGADGLRRLLDAA
jgi:chemotaxis protein MotB